jgi:hypothetical protein
MRATAEAIMPSWVVFSTSRFFSPAPQNSRPVTNPMHSTELDTSACLDPGLSPQVTPGCPAEMGAFHTGRSGSKTRVSGRKTAKTRQQPDYKGGATEATPGWGPGPSNLADRNNSVSPPNRNASIPFSRNINMNQGIIVSANLSKNLSLSTFQGFICEAFIGPNRQVAQLRNDIHSKWSGVAQPLRR